MTTRNPYQRSAQDSPLFPRAGGRAAYTRLDRNPILDEWRVKAHDLGPRYRLIAPGLRSRVVNLLTAPRTEVRAEEN